MADDASPGGGVTPVTGSRSGPGAEVWRRSPSTAYVESPGRVVVLDLDHVDHPPYVFEGSAAQIWACLDGERTEIEIVTELAEAYEATAEVVTEDVRQFVDRLQDLGLIVVGTDF